MRETWRKNEKERWGGMSKGEIGRDRRMRVCVREGETPMPTQLTQALHLLPPLPHLHYSVPPTSRHTQMRLLGIDLGH